MSKNKPKKPDQYRYVPIDKATRWQACQYIGKLLYYSNLENVEVIDFLHKLDDPPMVVTVVMEALNKINEKQKDKGSREVIML